MCLFFRVLKAFEYHSLLLLKLFGIQLSFFEEFGFNIATFVFSWLISSFSLEKTAKLINFLDYNFKYGCLVTVSPNRKIIYGTVRHGF